MRNIAMIGAIVSMTALISACTTTPEYKHIHADARPLIKEMDSVLISKQDQIGADIKVSKISQYVQGHIIPVLIDIGLNSYRSHHANKLIMPIRETMYEYDYTMDIKEELNLALASSKLGAASDLQILREEPQGFRAAYIRKSEADAVMFIDVNYAFTPKFDALNLTSAIMVFPVNQALSPYKEKPDTDDILEYEDNIYRNQFMASIPVKLEEGTRDENGAVWGNMSEEQLTTLLQAAARKLANHIANDLGTDAVSEEGVEKVDASTTDVIEPIISESEIDTEA